MIDREKPSARDAAENGAVIGYDTLPKSAIEGLAKELSARVEYQTTTTDAEGGWYWASGETGGQWPGQRGNIRTRARIVSDWIEVVGG